MSRLDLSSLPLLKALFFPSSFSLSLYFGSLHPHPTLLPLFLPSSPSVSSPQLFFSLLWHNIRSEPFVLSPPLLFPPSCSHPILQSCRQLVKWESRVAVAGPDYCLSLSANVYVCVEGEDRVTWMVWIRGIQGHNPSFLNPPFSSSHLHSFTLVSSPLSYSTFSTVFQPLSQTV